MENVKANKPKEGFWDNMKDIKLEMKPKVIFDINIPVVISMVSKNPREVPWEDGVFYVFDVMEKGEQKVITTSSWSLLRGLKVKEPIEGKVFKITKKLEKGKQVFYVEPNEESVTRGV